MRVRSAWLIPAALVAGLPLVIPLAAAQATKATSLKAPATKTAAAKTTLAVAKPTTKVAARRATSVTLPTGEHVRLSGKAGKEQVLVEPAAASGPGRSVVTRRLSGHTYVMPAVAEPYLGRFLDKSLFDVTSLNAALGKSGRLPVRISYQGSAPAAPGVTITSKSKGTAHGYLTAKSAAAFGHALTSAWQADAKAGFPKRTSLFTGLTKISADVPATGTVTPKYPMYTLVIKTIGPDGAPQPSGFLTLFNVDDGRKYAGFVIAENGEARVSVPKGNYAALGDDFAYNETTETGTFRIMTINEFKVTGADQTMTLDYRTATSEAVAEVPKPTKLSSLMFDWSRMDAKKYAAFDSMYFLDSTTNLLLAPSGPAKIGTLGTTYSWGLNEPVAIPTYTYSVVATDDEIPAAPKYSFTQAQLATVNAAYYGESQPRTAGALRFPLTDSGGGGTYDRVPRGTRRTEYAGAASGTPLWVDALISNYDSFEDPGFVDAPPRALPAGSTTSINWLKGPLAAAIPSQPEGGYCFGCRFGNTISVGLVPFTDSNLTHIGSIFGAEDGLPVARFRFYKNGKRVSDEDDRLGGSFTVPAGKATYKAVLDVDRRLVEPVQSTRTKTELTFKSAKNTGKKLSDNFYCEGDNCRVLPIVQARLSLPLDINGTLPAGKSTVTVSVAQVQGATKAAITKAGLEIRPAGWGWSTVKLTSIGGGKYQGVIDNTDFAGALVDVRFSGADKAGSSYLQTVVRAFTVAGS
ncbi:MAG TPA: hypothetical protein VLL08_24960 [Kineosporiaceae bacterium]|nr:hypothetical protein [Kineosporiaceae bacterium]